MRSLQILVQLLSAALLTQPLLAAPIFWFLPWSFPSFPSTTSSTSGTTGSSSSAANGASNSSNVSVAIGNRVNTSTGLDDYGTNISNVQINVNRQRRSVANTILDLNDLGGAGGAGADTDGGSYISIGEHTVRLPANISNLTLNTYLINGIPVDDSVLVSGDEMGNAGDPNLLVTAIRLFRKFLKSFLIPVNG
uniref:Putative gsg10 salivary mucin n=2 Tax=Nyssorhynchus TaxID=44543 RepID=A0A2M4AD38_9DIPT